MSEFKVGDCFLCISPLVYADVEQIVKIENNKYYFKTVKCVSGLFLDGNDSLSLEEIKDDIDDCLWKKVSNLQVKVLTGKINEGEK